MIFLECIGSRALPSGTPVEVVAVTAGIVTVKPLH